MGRQKVRDDGGDGTGALGPVADIADDGGEAGGDAREAGPIPRVALQLQEDVDHDIVGQQQKGGAGRLCHDRGGATANSAGSPLLGD